MDTLRDATTGNAIGASNPLPTRSTRESTPLSAFAFFDKNESSPTLYLDFYDASGLTLPILDTAVPANKYGQAALQLNTGGIPAAAGLGWLLMNTASPGGLAFAGVPAGAVGFNVAVTDTVTFNMAGTSDGTAGSGAGIATAALMAPNANSARQIGPLDAGAALGLK